MSVIGSNILAGASGQGGGYNLTRSLRFRSSASAYLSRTPASAGNRKTWTQSLWIKNSVGPDRSLVGIVQNSSQTQYRLFIDTNYNLRVFSFESGYQFHFITTQVFRDPSAWYHIQVVLDTTQATSTDRFKLYINGTQVTSFSTSVYPSLNADCNWNRNLLSQLGSSGSAENFFDGYLAEVNFIDGQALTPSSFGETSATTGVWQPKKYAGTYGTNGFYLPFTDNSALTTSSNVGLGKDFSGNGNYWTTNNISITSGATYDSMTDVPTLTSATASNFATLNPLDKGGNITLSAANLNYSTGATNMVRATMQIPSTGKWYWECTQTSSNSEQFGIATASASTGTYLGGDANGWSYGGSGNKFNNNSSSAYGASFTNGDVIGVAFDADAGTLTFYKNNVSQGTAFSSLTGSYFPAVGGNLSSGVINFGQRPFAYTPPTGFVALNTFNLPTPAIGATASTQANKYFDATLYTGNGSTNTITNAGTLAPALVWTKGRGFAWDNILHDSVRGVNKRIMSNLTNAEVTDTDALTAFNSNGFTLGAEGGVNNSGSTYVAWQWAGNGTGVTNTAGSITSTVSANTTSGFSVVTYTGTGANATVGHGLGVAPKMILHKVRTVGTGWAVWHGSYPTPTTQLLELNTTGALLSSSTYWNSSLPTSTTIPLGTYGGVNTNGGTHVAYCFSEVSGYSKFGSYTGNGSSDGTFVALPFTPKFVMTKRTDSSSNWVVNDIARAPYNVTGANLYPNSSASEESYTIGAPAFDFLSNGFKLRGSGSDTNANGATYIYMAFADVPQKFSLGH